jgi:hypothetical protein
VFRGSTSVATLLCRSMSTMSFSLASLDFYTDETQLASDVHAYRELRRSGRQRRTAFDRRRTPSVSARADANDSVSTTTRSAIW